MSVIFLDENLVRDLERYCSVSPPHMSITIQSQG